MPNWTENTLTISGTREQVQEFIDLCANLKEGTFLDFNKFIPMPELLQCTRSGSREFNGQRYRSWYVERPGMAGHDEAGERPFTDDEKAELRRIGFDNWYDWSIEKWGTKWNARAGPPSINGDGTVATIRFDTAWCAPVPVFKEMKRRTQCKLTLTYRLEEDRYDTEYEAG